ncbi:MAG TPA: hypothetical protein VML55_06940 [Planctomycetaceae bacterium]|nr:hypothetical protein [Planctomycetaceae bacterium]
MFAGLYDNGLTCWLGRTLEADHDRRLGIHRTMRLARAFNRRKNAGLLEERDRLLHLTEIGKLAYDVITLAFYPVYARAWMQERQRAALGRRRGVAPGVVAD